VPGYATLPIYYNMGICNSFSIHPILMDCIGGLSVRLSEFDNCNYYQIHTHNQ